MLVEPTSISPPAIEVIVAVTSQTPQLNPAHCADKIELESTKKHINTSVLNTPPDLLIRGNRFRK
jgi:undecaprenyl pyrophosphate synthase